MSNPKQSVLIHSNLTEGKSVAVQSGIIADAIKDLGDTVHIPLYNVRNNTETIWPSLTPFTIGERYYTRTHCQVLRELYRRTSKKA